MTAAAAPMSGAARGLLIGAGALVLGLGILLLFFWHTHVVELVGTDRLISGVGLRVAEAAVLYGGTWCVVRGWNGRGAGAS
ncbi:hypothetical protein ACFP1Z_09170 [Streptomyces gamaensis]|uniref:Uncharacterized protein n=1 Tax=Streptomyces gamaensis TaxID=1763542 RepID=A0ABW0YY34_9ACTN